MLQLHIPVTSEGWDEEKQEFVEPVTVTIELENSLVALAEWESKWCKAFLADNNKTDEETLDYIRCMTLTPNVDPDIYNHLTKENINQVNKYIESPMTATHISDNSGASKGHGGSKDTVTSELIYYWMISLNIPKDFERWHLNRLITLIKVCEAKNSPAKTRSGKDTARQYAAMNAARRKKHNSRG